MDIQSITYVHHKLEQYCAFQLSYYLQFLQHHSYYHQPTYVGMVGGSTNLLPLPPTTTTTNVDSKERAGGRGAGRTTGPHNLGEKLQYSTAYYRLVCQFQHFPCFSANFQAILRPKMSYSLRELHPKIIAKNLLCAGARLLMLYPSAGAC